MQKKFPLDASLDQLMEFFEKFGRTELVVMRRDPKKAFKVSEFSCLLRMIMCCSVLGGTVLGIACMSCC
jgi:hypothetical protein